MLLTLVTLSLLADVAPRRPPPSQCRADTDCVLSTFQGCCGSCCKGPPHAVPRRTKENDHCAMVDCEMPDCAAVRCAAPVDPASFAAVCRSGQCVATQKVDSPAECRADGECRVVTTPSPGAACLQSPCGCCPASRAVPVDAVVPLKKKPVEKKARPDFGLSTGGPTLPPQAPPCSACQRPENGVAVCRAGRCVLSPVVIPSQR